MYYAYAFNRGGEIVGQAQGQDGCKLVMALYRSLRNAETKRTGWIYDLLEVDEPTAHTLDVYISARPYSGDLAACLLEDADLFGPVLLRPADHCAAWQRHLKQCAEDEWRSAFNDEEIAQAELDTTFAWCHPAA